MAELALSPALVDDDPAAAATLTDALPPVPPGVLGEFVDPGALAALARRSLASSPPL